MNSLARILTVYLLVVLGDALTGYRLLGAGVRLGARAYCRLSRRPDPELCAYRVLMSQCVWTAIAAFVGVLAGSVAPQAVQTGKF